MAVVGGGPAGMAAAEAAAAGGAEVVLIDDEPRLGGSLLYGRDADGVRPRPSGWRRPLAARGMRVLSEAVCTGLFADRWLAVVQGNRLYKLRAGRWSWPPARSSSRRCSATTTCRACMLASAAQRLMRL